MSVKGSSTSGSAARSAAATATKAATMALAYKDGDILLRAGEEQWIMELTAGRFSHSGICIHGSSMEAADAHPVDIHRSEGHEVAMLPITDFFSPDHALGGGEVFRYKGDKSKAEAAARWGESETGNPYEFELMDPIIGSGGAVENNNRLYCSEFVWRCYRFGAGVTLVDPKGFVNFLDSAHKDKTLRILTRYVREHQDAKEWYPDWLISDKKIQEGILDKLAAHNGLFIAPQQLADSPQVKRVHTIPAPVAPSSGDGKKK